MNFFAFKTVPEADGTITTMNITTEIIPPGITMDGYMDQVMEIVLQNHTLVSREVGSINGMETGRMVLDFTLGDKPGKKVVYILRESPSKIWGLTYSTSAENFDANANDFHQSVRTFRSTAMLAQQAAAAAAGGAGPTPTPEGLLIYDDFSNDQSGWDTFNNEQISRYYSEGSYHFFFFQEDLIAASAIGNNLSAARVEVDAWMANPTGPEAYGEMGIVCGFQDASNYYFLSIRSDGYFGVFQKAGEDIHFVGLEDWGQSATIKTGNAPNRLAAECSGTTLRLFVNGVLMAEVQAAEPVSGQVGLYGGSFDWRDTHIQFDNFMVIRP
jgi:hypothetical protein